MIPSENASSEVPISGITLPRAVTNSNPSINSINEIAPNQSIPNNNSNVTDEENNDSTWLPSSSQLISMSQTISHHLSVENGTQEQVTPLNGKSKRKYRFTNRSRKSIRKGNKKTWNDLINSMSEDEWKRITCCKSAKCFENCDIPFLLTKVRFVLTLSQSERRNFLHNMLTSDGYFSFNNNRVCAEFLSRSFHFSRDMQCSIKGTKGCKSKRNIGTNSSKGSNTSMECIVSFLNREAELSSNIMPDSKDIHLPFKLKEHVYNQFVDQYSKLNRCEPPSKSYFLSVWKHKCNHIKVRKHTRFSICSTCEQIDAAITKNMKSNKHTGQLLQAKKEHMDFVLRERCEYRQKSEKAKLFPSKYISIIIDGADQSAFGLPHFCSSTKDQRGHSLKVRLIGILDHAVINRLFLMTLTEEYETGANHIIEAIHRFIVIKCSNGPLPTTLYVQMDNCTRENKNRYLMAYLESLVSWGLFETIEVGFLPIGHTHEDIDQAFSATSRRLRSNNAITLQDLQHELGQTYNERTTIISMEGVINFSGLCEDSKCLRDVEPFSHYRYFLFKKFVTSTSTARINTICHVKVNSNESWKPLQSKPESHSFINTIPQLSDTPPLIIPSIGNEEKFYNSKNEFTTRLISEETRINDSNRYRQLHLLKEKVFERREEPFHWDLTTCPESNYSVMNSDPNYNSIGKDSDNVNDGSDYDYENEMVENDYNYDLNSFVAVKPEDADDSPFWIGKITQIYKNKEQKISSIEVHWFMPSDHGNLYTGKYKASFLNSANRPPWTDKIHSDSVILTFTKLNADGKLPSAIHKRLRSN